MPTKITYDCLTGEQTEVEMEGDELAAHLALVATPDPPPPVHPLVAIAADLDVAAETGDAAVIARTIASSLRAIGGLQQ